MKHGSSKNTLQADKQARREGGALPSIPQVDDSRMPARVVGPLGRIESRGAILLLVAMSVTMTFLMYPSINWSWLGFVCLVPWLIAVCSGKKARFVYFASWLFGLGYFFINIRWMIPVTKEGYIALCAYFSLVFPLAAWPIRHMYQRHGVSVAITAPIVWVAMEYVRTLRPLSFPWLLLGHTQYQQITLIQISDLVGVYGVSFVLAMVNGWFTDLLIQPILVWRKDQGSRIPIGTLMTFVVVAATIIYGMAQSSTRYFKPGPKVAIIQHDFPMYVDERAHRTLPDSILKAHVELVRQAAAEKPDLILLPETVMVGWMNDEFINAPPTALEEILRRRHPGWELRDLQRYQDFGRRAKDTFQKLSDESGSAILLGAAAMEWKPTAIPPRAEAYNSAFLLLPRSGTNPTTKPASPVARYDKNHLVIFGEYVPFRFTYHWLYEWLNGITPWGKGGRDYSLTPGEQFNTMEFPSRTDPKIHYRAGTPICYEEIMPYIGREFNKATRKQKNVDMLLAISNDGWFLHTPELEQHLAGSIFRAVENRIAIARSVNTGASSAVDPNGHVRSRVRMSDEKLSRLDSVNQSISKLSAKLDELSKSSTDAEYTKTWQALSAIIYKDYTAAVEGVGRELLFMRDRLSYMVQDLLADRSTTGRVKAIAEFRDQLDEDQSTLKRWRERPDTAPSYSVESLRLDDRLTLYSRWGDFFAKAALLLYIVMVGDWLVRRIFVRRT